MELMPIKAEYLSRFQQRLIEHFGLLFDAQEQQELLSKLNDRMRALDIQDLGHYLNIIAADNSTGQGEWWQLANNLTNTESYFFRDAGQMILLRERVLPDLIRRRRPEQRLNILSAGCASGEEAYTLAILLNELLGGSHEWQLDIVGMDINDEALKLARQAIYRDWSFRGVPKETQRRYFSDRHGGQRLDRQIAEMVHFERQNILAADFPEQSGYRDYFDLIICRNVFIYFSSGAVTHALEKLNRALKPDGLLLTGHGELIDQDMHGFRLHIYPKSVLYQRADSNTAEPSSLASIKLPAIRPLPVRSDYKAYRTSAVPAAKAVKQLEVHSEKSDTYLETIKGWLKQKDYHRAEQKLVQRLQQSPDDYDALLLLAQLKADRGEHNEATRYCQLAMQQQRFACAPHFLMAQIYQEQGDNVAALNELKKTIYLDPDHIAAYVQAAILQISSKKYKVARQMYMTALDLLKGIPPGRTVECFDSLIAGKLLIQIEQALQQIDGAN